MSTIHDLITGFYCKCVLCVQVHTGGKAQQKQRPFDFTKYNIRHVALKIAYLGWDYQVNYAASV